MAKTEKYSHNVIVGLLVVLVVFVGLHLALHLRHHHDIRNQLKQDRADLHRGLEDLKHRVDKR